MDLVRGNEGERCALNIVLPPSIDLDQDLGRGEMGRASGQRQLCHAHTHGPERYLGTFRTSYSYSYLSIVPHSCSYSRYLGTFLPPLCLGAYAQLYSDTRAQRYSWTSTCHSAVSHESSSPKYYFKFRLTVANHPHVECMAKLCGTLFTNPTI